MVDSGINTLQLVMYGELTVCIMRHRIQFRLYGSALSLIGKGKEGEEREGGGMEEKKRRGEERGVTTSASLNFSDALGQGVTHSFVTVSSMNNKNTAIN